METNSNSELNSREKALNELLNEEKKTVRIYNTYISDITNILVEESELYERIRKIQNRLMMLQYDLGNLD
jgi:hypothetical protein